MTQSRKRTTGLFGIAMLIGAALTLRVQFIGTAVHGADDASTLPHETWSAAGLKSMDLGEQRDIDWITVESGETWEREKILFEGQNVVSVWEAGPAKILVDTPFTYDEFVLVLKGTLVLTDLAGNSATYKEGDMFVVPEGFQGTWDMTEEYRELIIIDRDLYYGE